MAKKKQTINCSTCFYGQRRQPDPGYIMCRRYPEHRKLPDTHWCGEYLDDKTGSDLVMRDKQ